MDRAEQKEPTHTLGLWLVFVAFFLSGFAGLLYESQWSQYLKIFLGHSAYAQAIVLILFMGGMFVGSLLMARLMHRIEEPLKLYAYIELAIGAFALFFHPLFIKLIDVSFHQVFPNISSPVLIHLYKWLLALLLIFPQTILLGMTFPLMVSGVIRRYPGLPGNSIASLYFINSVGAAIGVLVTTFYLMLHFGLSGSMTVGSFFNFAVVVLIMIAFLFLNKPKEQEYHKKNANKAYDFYAYVILIAALATGFASFVYEISWIRMLAMVLGSSMHAFELMLSAFILGLALGALFIRMYIEKIKDLLYALGLIQIIMGGLALSTIFFYNHTFYMMQKFLEVLSRTEAAYTSFNFLSQGIAYLIMLPTTFCAGMTLPLMTTLLIKRLHGEKSVGDIYAWNMIGSILGVVFAFSVGLTLFGLKNLLNFAAFIDVLAGVFLLILAAKLWRPSSLFLLIIVLVGFGFTVFYIRFDPILMSSGVYRHGGINPNRNIVFIKDGRSATVTVEKSPQEFVISTNGKPDASIAFRKDSPPSLDEPTQVLLATYPLAIKPDAEDVAVIGFGSGTTSHLLLTNKTLKRVDTIEIEPAMVEGAKQFKELVSNVFNDPRSHIIIEDAKTHFSTTKRKYDLIIAEPSNPWVSGVASLFTVEFYSELKHYLKKDGYFVQWMHLYEMNTYLTALVINSLSSNFPYYEVYETIEGDIVIIAALEPLAPFSNKIFNNDALKQRLTSNNITSLDDLNLRYIGNQNALSTYATFFSGRHVAMNSDYQPTLELLAPKARFMRQFSNLNKINLDSIMNVLDDKPLGNQVSKSPISAKSKRYHAIQTLYQVLVNQQGTSDIEWAFMFTKSEEYCQSPNSKVFWNNALYSLIGESLAFLNKEQQLKLWPILLPKDCLQSLAPPLQHLLSFLESYSRNDYNSTVQSGKMMMNSPGFDALPPAVSFLIVRTYLIAALKMNQNEEVITVMEKDLNHLFKQGSLSEKQILQIEILYAYALTKKNVLQSH